MVAYPATYAVSADRQCQVVTISVDVRQVYDETSATAGTRSPTSSEPYLIGVRTAYPVPIAPWWSLPAPAKRQPAHRHLLGPNRPINDRSRRIGPSPRPLPLYSLAPASRWAPRT